MSDSKVYDKTIGFAARKLNLSSTHTQRLVDSGALVSIRDSAGRRLLCAQEIDALAKKRRKQR